MGMTIDKAILRIEHSSMNVDDKETADFIIKTMRKYEKIQEIVAKWKVDSWTDNLSYECMIEIAEIIDKSESEEI